MSSPSKRSPTDIRIRRATPADVATVGRLGALLVKTHYEFDPKRFIAPTSRTAQGYASFLGSQLEDPDVAVLVAEEDDAVIGYAYAGLEDSDRDDARAGRTRRRLTARGRLRATLSAIHAQESVR